MNIKSLSDTALLEQTEQLVRGERALLTEILHHLREIERRRLFSQLGLRSLFDYATKRLGYADDQAMRRISAMRLLKELPELEEKIADGRLSLTNLSLAQTAFRREPGISREQKLDVMAELESKSKREAEKILVEHASAPQSLRPDRVRVIGEDSIEVRFSAGVQLQVKLEKLKGLLAHSHPNMTLAETIDWLCDQAIQRLDPGEQPPAPALKPRVEKAGRGHIPAAVRREVWRKAASRCENCGSVHGLQIDHVKPVALGGTNDRENLRLLCRSCNQRAAINEFGLEKMAAHLGS